MKLTPNHFGTLTPRMQAYRESLLCAKPQVCAERAMLTTESYRQHADKPVVLRRAYMLQNILEKMTIYIEPETLLAGNQASANRAAPIFPEYAMDWVIRELDEFEKREADFTDRNIYNAHVMKFSKEEFDRDKGIIVGNIDEIVDTFDAIGFQMTFHPIR